ncbi:hypothetical protein L3Q82_019282, partial [Scortum barcoo]
MSHREETSGEDPGHAGETMPLGWPGNASGSPRKSWRKCLGGTNKQVILILTKLYDFHIGSVTESTLW